MTSSGTSFRCDSTRGYTTLALLPGINDARWGDIESVGNQILHEIEPIQAPALMIDLSALSYMGSAVVALIVRVWKSTREKGGRMVVVTSHEVVYEVLKIAGLTTVWEIVDSQEKAESLLAPAATSSPFDRGAALLLNVLGVVAVAVAAAGLLLLLRPVEQVSPNVARMMEFGFSIVGIIIGTISTTRDSGGNRVVGVLVVLASLGISLAGVLNAQ